MIDVSERDFVTIQGFLAKHVPECEVWAFGSRATWTAKEHSDLDLVIVGPNKLETRVFNSLKEAFDESALPYRVDVLDWHGISPEFKRNIEKNYVVIRKAGQKSANAWQYYKVTDFAEVVGGGTPKTGVPEYWGGEIPWITPKDLSDHNERYISNGERSITKEGLKNSAARLVPENTVLLTSRAPVGYLAIAKKPLTTNQGFRSLIIKEGFSPEFIYYLLLNNVDYLKQHASGSTFQELSGGTLKNLQFQIPALPEQKGIAEILSNLDEKIELNQQMNKTLEATAQALFNQWFVEFAFPGYEKTKFVDGLPEGWKMGTFGEISINFDSKRVPLSSRERDGRKGEYPYYGAASIVDYVDDYLFDGVYVLLGEDGTVITDDGFPVLQYVWGKFWVNNHAHVLQGKSGISTEFIMLLLRQTNIQHIVTGAVQPKINQNNMNNIAITIPEKALLDEFQQVIKPIYEKFRNNAEETKMLIKTRDSLLPKLMSGKIRIQKTIKLED
jgi:type I restriction enzyme S subunit